MVISISSLENQNERCLRSFKSGTSVSEVDAQVGKFFDEARSLVDRGAVDDYLLDKIKVEFFVDPANHPGNPAMLTAIFFILAEKALINGDREEAWYFLSEALYFKGQFEHTRSRTSSTQTASQKGNKARSEKLALAKTKAAELLSELAAKYPQRRMTQQDAVDAIKKDFVDFVAAHSIPLKESVVSTRLLEWIKKAPTVKKAFEEAQHPTTS